MRITQWGEYGILCSLSIAEAVQNKRAPIGAAEIANAQGIALQYTQQILQRLRKGDIIASVRGPHGGYQLARPAEEITIAHILRAAEGDTFELICDTKPINPEACSADLPCCLRDLWQDLRRHIDSFLEARTLQDLLKQNTPDSIPVQLGRHRPVLPSAPAVDEDATSTPVAGRVAAPIEQ
ncbi:MAG: Rrf2 family transcriptional regulator [Bdellovibrionales bacterium]|nr:Rrf2 family transcriptional regulator [Bdellovibrionales bacterium]